MKREWILWNVLQKPEDIKRDERMEQIEWKSYFWCYKVLLVILFLSMIFRNIVDVFIAYENSFVNSSLFVGLWICAGAMVIEGGRFLYNCYHGTQEFSDWYSGKTIFLSYGIFTGFWGWLLFVTAFGIKNGWAWLIWVLGTIFYWLLCHLAYLHFALSIQEDTEKKAIQYGKWFPTVCGLLLVLYYGITCAVTSTAFVREDNFSQNSSLTEEEIRWLQEIDRGREHFYELESCKMECVYFIDTQEQAPVYQDGSIAHAYYWRIPDYSYTQILNFPTDDSVYREFYGDISGQWYGVNEREWIPVEDYWEAYMNTNPEDDTVWAMEPYTGILKIDSSEVESVRKEYKDELCIYTVQYGDSYKTYGERLKIQDGKGFARAVEQYTLNEFGVLVAYGIEETGVLKETGEAYTEKKEITVWSVNREENEKEVLRQLQQYKTGTAHRNME